MAIRNGELMHECFPKHLIIVTARMIKYKETVEDGKKRCVRIESKAGTKIRSPDGLSLPNQNTIKIKLIC